MGYIKKLKNNELVGGTDKHTIYPVTSTEAVFEEVTNGNESSFKSQKTINKEQQDELDAHNGRVTYLEDHAVKSVTINGGTKTYTVDDTGNVNLDVYTTESAEGQATLAEEVGDIRSIVGTKDSPASDTLVNRVGELETLVGGSGQGSVNTRIANAKAEILGDAAEDYNTLGKVEDKIQEEVARATAEETELSIYVHAIEGGNIRVKTSTPTNPDTGAPANTVYRVAGTTTYSDYMWNGTTMVKMAEYNVDTLESQFGYYKWETASNTISITTNNQVAGSPIGSYVLTSGGSFKIKMTNKATGACTLNMNGTGVKTLLYNGDPIDSSNTWDAGEVISVYYDGTYYQASNAQGGGSAMGKKRLYGRSGYNTLLNVGIGNTVGAATADSPIVTYEQKVNEGDVICITAQGANAGRCWGFIDSNRTLLAVEDAGVFCNNKVLVVPAGVDKVVFDALVTDISGIKGYPDYEWYYAKAGSVGAHEMLTEAYLYGDLRTLTVGQAYEEGEAVKTTENQLLRITKTITPMTITDTVVVGDVKVFDNGVIYGTYKAQKAVSAYNGTETEGLYAIGRPSIVTVTVDATSLSIEEDTDVTVTIGESTQTITVPAAESETKAADIAALIAAAFTSVPGWTLADNEDGTLTLKCNTGGANTIVVDSEVGETGLVITSTAVSGADTLSQYNEGVWEDVAIADYAADAAEIGVSDNTKMWQKLSVQNIINNYTTQNSISSSLDEIGTYETIETLIFNQTTRSAGAGASDAYLTVPVNFMVGNRYKIVATLSRTINMALTSYLRQSPGSSTGITLSGLSIPAGLTRKEYYYEPKEGNNYQYFDRYAKTTHVITVNYKVYLVGSKTVKKKVEELDDKIENIKVGDIHYDTSIYKNADNNFSWQTGNPSNASYPTVANKYFIIDTKRKIKKLHVYKAYSDLYMLTTAYVNGSYIDIGVPTGLSVNSTVDLTNNNYSKIYCLLYRQGGQALPTTAEAKAQNIELTFEFALDGVIDSLDNRVTELETFSGGLKFTNPIIRTNYPDPAIWWGEDGYWYAFSTGDFATRTMYRSANLVHWENTGEIPFTENAVSTMVGFNKTYFWAAEVVKIGDRWNMYLSTETSPLFVFTSNQPTCGFEYVKCLIANQTDSGFVNNDNNIGVGQNIDPCVRIDRENKVWLFWGSLQKIWRVRLTDDGLSLLNKDKEHVAGLDGGQDVYRNNVYEGAYLYRRKKYWYLFVSAGGYRDETYCIKVGRCQTLDGTFVDKEGNLMTEGHATLIMSSPNTTNFFGTGHNGPIITDKDNKTWLFFHSHWKGMDWNSRPMCISEVLWDSDGWPYFVNDTLTVSGVGPRM